MSYVIIKTLFCLHKIINLKNKGGFGMILSRGSIERLIHPIYCNNQNDSTSNTVHNNSSSGSASNKFLGFGSQVCTRLFKDNLVKEKSLH